MATLRDLRKRATVLGIEYAKEDDKDTLEELITAKECEVVDETPVEPAPVEPEPVGEPDPVVEPEPVTTPVVKRAPKKAPAPVAGKSSFHKDLSISRDDLQTEFLEQPGKYGFYAEATARANSTMMSAKVRMDVIEAELFGKHKQMLIDAGEAKPTEKSITSSMIRSDEWQAGKAAFIKATTDYEVIKAGMFALQHRRDMLIQLGSSARAEGANTSINTHERVKELLATS
ncbi:MAG: hypothetical protein JEZ11_17940 [Desulfobacterales bacterium]|nr:hypothetical protein [Desulfobacterales bacterium]